MAHSDRERIPKGFIRSLKFDLVGIDDGQAVLFQQLSGTGTMLSVSFQTSKTRWRFW